MIYPVQITLVLLCGVMAGLLYFSGLMLTVLTIRRMHRPGVFLVGSFILRAVFVIVVFFAISNGQWQRFAACLVGFIIARQLTVMLWRPSRSGPGKQLEVRQWRS